MGRGSPNRLLDAARPWIEGKLGASLSEAGSDPIPVLAIDGRPPGEPPLWAVKVGDEAIVVARSSWVEQLRPVVAGLHADLLFSIFGAYELSRITLPDGVGVWGPTWHMFGDETTLRPVQHNRAVKVVPSELAGIDWEIFWHCPRDDSLAGFAVFEEDEVAALATVSDQGDPVWEIGVDAAPDAMSRGLGREVVAAAMEWILENGKVPLATVGPFNVPSARTLRSVGLRYVMSEMKGMKRPFRVPPQPLGRPYEGVELHDYYPAWAMNKDIVRR